MLVQVRAPTFVAGFVFQDGKVVKCAPILRKTVIGKTPEQIREAIKRKGWKAVIVRTTARRPNSNQRRA